MEYLIALFLGFVGSILAWEVSLHYHRWCVTIIRHAVTRLPLDQRETRYEEWLAALEEHVGLVSSLSHAIGCWIGAPAVGKSTQPKPAEAKLSRKSANSASHTKSKAIISIAMTRSTQMIIRSENLISKLIRDSDRERGTRSDTINTQISMIRNATASALSKLAGVTVAGLVPLIVSFLRRLLNLFF